MGFNSTPMSKPGPTFFGTHRAGLTPSPQNQVPNLTGRGAPEAKAVPLVFRKQSRIGSATETAAPFKAPFSTVRRSMSFFMISSSQSVRADHDPRRPKEVR